MTQVSEKSKSSSEPKLEPSLASSKIKLEYANLLDHINILREVIRHESTPTAEVYEMPIPTESDIGTQTIDLTSMKVLRGEQALDRALAHYGQNILRDDQAGVMAHRLPGIIWLNNVDEQDILARIRKINLIKDAIRKLVHAVGDSAFAQFNTMKKAIPYAVRKSISRHILAIDSTDPIKNFGYSISNRISVSKPQPRDDWIEKIKDARDNISLVDERTVEDWQQMYDNEIKILSALSDTTQLRVRRPLRKAPIVNLKYTSKRTNTHIAHSPILLLNHDPDNMRYQPFKPVVTNAISTVTGDAVIHRMHLYLAVDKKSVDNDTQHKYSAEQLH